MSNEKNQRKKFSLSKKTPAEMNIKLKKKITKETVISNAIKPLFTVSTTSPTTCKNC